GGQRLVPGRLWQDRDAVRGRGPEEPHGGQLSPAEQRPQTTVPNDPRGSGRAPGPLFFSLTSPSARIGSHPRNLRREVMDERPKSTAQRETKEGHNGGRVPGPLPAGRHGLPREFVVSN